MNQSERNIEEDYEFGTSIGRGAYGEVVKAINRRTKNKVAIKIISKNTPRFKLKRFQKERDIIKSFDHPNIMGYIDCYEDDSFYYIVSEYIKYGELFNYVLSNENIPIKRCKKIFCQLLSAVEYCHGNMVAHRDIKLENIMISDIKNCIVKLIDFGFATKLNLHSMHKKKCGSPEYAAPELMYSDKYNPFKSDIWSLGVVLFSLVTGSFPFPSPNTKRPFTYDTITKQYSVLEYHRSAIKDPLLNDLLSKIFVLPENRISIDEIKNHPWLKGVTFKSYLPIILFSKSDKTELKEIPLSQVHQNFQEGVALRIPKEIPIIDSLIEKMVELGFNQTNIMKSLVNKTKTVELIVYYHLFEHLGIDMENSSNEQSWSTYDHMPRHQYSDPMSTESVNSTSGSVKRKFVSKSKYCKFMVDITMGYFPMVGYCQKMSSL
ncbi:putative SNF1-related protein kinase catalytic subunit alpha KIN11-like [Tupanvirus deep ocean]|uniref:SNF1-related protein kinase catalytic subunit alpha KIN11-like n=2 Tax=Tupanvirus TaxID=2094720 RepID=A0AC62A9F0_9VIRU|nr:putative SNF1-related protein kinase catalytic subunit alpha KIN11-like [Tupanvirus deep ocean]QKU34405.1 putative SNF1-related protein kinase catalytic subunit alpha KIN11-like [Tupanvirus deep ocean]